VHLSFFLLFLSLWLSGAAVWMWEMSVPDSEEWCCEVAVSHFEWGSSPCHSEWVCVCVSCVWQHPIGSKKPSEKWRATAQAVIDVGLCGTFVPSMVRPIFPQHFLLAVYNIWSLRTTAIQVYSICFDASCTIKTCMTFFLWSSKEESPRWSFRSVFWPGPVNPWEE